MNTCLKPIIGRDFTFMNKVDDAIHDPFIIDVVDESYRRPPERRSQGNQFKASSVPGKPEIK